MQPRQSSFSIEVCDETSVELLPVVCVSSSVWGGTGLARRSYMECLHA